MPSPIHCDVNSENSGHDSSLREPGCPNIGNIFVRWMAPLVLIAAWANPANAVDGKAIALHGNRRGAAPCAPCHGMRRDHHEAAGFPRLSGLNAQYLQTQLLNYATGSRRNAVMASIASQLSTDEIKAVAKFYASLSIPERSTKHSGGDTTGEKIAQRGLWTNGVPACVQCHGPNATGVGTAFPALTGQSRLYLIKQLQAWKRDKRPPGPLGLMPAIAKRLSDEQVDTVAGYFATQAPRRATAPAAHAPDGMPKGPLGDMVGLGYRIFADTPRYARKYVGNDLRCANCHLDFGRLADSAPLWAAWVSYPAYRSKNKHVNSYAERLQGCFRYSMNGKPPPLDSQVLLALESYSFWLAKGKPTGEKLRGRGYPGLARPTRPADYQRGKAVYRRHCALCHQNDGQGLRVADRTQFPALWGPDSFNWGAGMHSLKNASGFIKANMPLGQGGTLSDQQAWDVAMYIDSHERPQDPRFTGSVAETRRKFHNSAMSMYGRRVNGHVLGHDSVPSGGTTRTH